MFCRVCARKEGERERGDERVALRLLHTNGELVWIRVLQVQERALAFASTQVLNIPSAEFTCPKHKAHINITSTMYSLPPARSLTFAPSPPLPCVRKLCAFHSCLPPPSLSPYSRCRAPLAAVLLRLQRCCCFPSPISLPRFLDERERERGKRHVSPSVAQMHCCGRRRCRGREGTRVERMDRRAYSEREKEGVRERAMVLVYFDPCGTPERVHW